MQRLWGLVLRDFRQQRKIKWKRACNTKCELGLYRGHDKDNYKYYGLGFVVDYGIGYLIVLYMTLRTTQGRLCEGYRGLVA